MLECMWANRLKSTRQNKLYVEYLFSLQFVCIFTMLTITKDILLKNVYRSACVCVSTSFENRWAKWEFVSSHKLYGYYLSFLQFIYFLLCLQSKNIFLKISIIIVINCTLITYFPCNLYIFVPCLQSQRTCF